MNFFYCVKNVNLLVYVEDYNYLCSGKTVKHRKRASEKHPKSVTI